MDRRWFGYGSKTQEAQAYTGKRKTHSSVSCFFLPYPLKETELLKSCKNWFTGSSVSSGEYYNNGRQDNCPQFHQTCREKRG